MTAIAKVLSRALSAKITVFGVLRQFALFGAAALFVGLLLATEGLDLSAGFF